MYTKKQSAKHNELRNHSGRIEAVSILALFLVSLSATAQCAMCRAALEGEGNTAKAQAVNDGIVYLMIFPYLLVGAIGFAIYRMNKKKKA